MERERQKTLIEAILFLNEDPVRLEKLADILELPREETREIVAELQHDLAAASRGIRIFEVAGGYQLGTPPELAGDLERAIGEEGGGSISNAALETLAIIAYKQPITKSEIEHIRGVSCDYAIQKLLEKELVAISGKSEGPGRPIMYSTSDSFM
ncbi:MAG TPA: SMC-Scp complex subunit ScpB, partial [Bacillota bacterium]|nr:SMC-Scp complex subunit ScpB [Bacillota bacterium]